MKIIAFHNPRTLGVYIRVFFTFLFSEVDMSVAGRLPAMFVLIKS